MLCKQNVLYYMNKVFCTAETKCFVLQKQSVLYCRNKVFITMN